MTVEFLMTVAVNTTVFRVRCHAVLLTGTNYVMFMIARVLYLSTYSSHTGEFFLGNNEKEMPFLLQVSNMCLEPFYS
jgi:hypothetical protein